MTAIRTIGYATDRRRPWNKCDKPPSVCSVL